MTPTPWQRLRDRPSVIRRAWVTRSAVAWGLAGLWLLAPLSFAAPSKAPKPIPMLLGWEGTVEVLPSGSTDWMPARTNQVLHTGDLVRTGPRSRATVRFSTRTPFRIGERTRFRVPSDPAKKGVLEMIRGVLYYLHRGEPGDFPMESPSGHAAVFGTEFTLTVADDGSTRLDLIDGQVQLTNQAGGLMLQSGEAGQMSVGLAPVRVPVLAIERLVQWNLYYPGLLYPGDLDAGFQREADRQASLRAYAAGDLKGALQSLPQGRPPATDAERVYTGAVLLSVGQVDEAEASLQGVDRQSPAGPLAAALRWGIDTVRGAPDSTRSASGTEVGSNATATEWLAKSYADQARFDLNSALLAAQRAVARSPDFAFGWARIAELEFSFGRLAAARTALSRSLVLAPRHAQAVALQGFLLAAENRPLEAEASFDRAIALDSGLGNGWLGRGLMRLRRGRLDEGREDLLIAATVEPQRAALRSTLAKAFAATGDLRRALHELELARHLDPRDPTAWLYAALLNQQQNRINDAVRDLETSQRLNDDRMVYRSRLLLDQDRAVRGANLATLYQDAGMAEVAHREAARAVHADYANYSAHLFLANSYDALRDPNQIDIRYETPWLSEYLVANLLAPVGAGTLSQTVSQNEYSRLFDRDRVGLVSQTEYLSRGDWTQAGAVHGVTGNTGFALEEFYRSRNGQQRTDHLEQLTLGLQFKQQLTPHDSVYLQALRSESEGGDLTAYYQPNSSQIRGLRVSETQEPLLLAGYHHEWAPGSHTLFLTGRLQDSYEVRNPEQSILLLEYNDTGRIASTQTTPQRYESDLEIYTAEAQQILQRGPHTLIAGARGQAGEFETRHRNPNFFNLQQEENAGFSRASGYFYEQWQIWTPLQLVAGLTADALQTPRNHRYGPLTPGEETTHRLSPKAGLVYAPGLGTVIRAAYAQSLGGASLDQSVQLEPTQVAGFNHAWRSLIPESVAGANSAARFESWGIALDQKLPSGTYAGVTIGLLESKVGRTLGTYDTFAFGSDFDLRPGSTRERLQYEERFVRLDLHQLVGRDWIFGASYRLGDADLRDRFREINSSWDLGAGFRPHQHFESRLHQLDLNARYIHPSGLFALGESTWYGQSNSGYVPQRQGDAFWQFNAFLGYRFPQRRAEIKLGLLNIADQDYRLNPLNLNRELARDRTLLASVRLFF